MYSRACARRRAASMRKLTLPGSPLGADSGAALLSGVRANANVSHVCLEATTVPYALVVAIEQAVKSNADEWNRGVAKRRAQRLGELQVQMYSFLVGFVAEGGEGVPEGEGGKGILRISFGHTRCRKHPRRLAH
eukprot:3778287-Pleurochrysis_carterae.AAC.1